MEDVTLRQLLDFSLLGNTEIISLPLYIATLLLDIFQEYLLIFVGLILVLTAYDKIQGSQWKKVLTEGGSSLVLLLGSLFLVDGQVDENKLTELGKNNDTTNYVGDEGLNKKNINPLSSNTDLQIKKEYLLIKAEREFIKIGEDLADILWKTIIFGSPTIDRSTDITKFTWDEGFKATRGYFFKKIEAAFDDGKLTLEDTKNKAKMSAISNIEKEINNFQQIVEESKYKMYLYSYYNYSNTGKIGSSNTDPLKKKEIKEFVDSNLMKKDSRVYTKSSFDFSKENKDFTKELKKYMEANKLFFNQKISSFEYGSDGGIIGSNFTEYVSFSISDTFNFTDTQVADFLITDTFDIDVLSTNNTYFESKKILPIFLDFQNFVKNVSKDTKNILNMDNLKKVHKDLVDIENSGMIGKREPDWDSKTGNFNGTWSEMVDQSRVAAYNQISYLINQHFYKVLENNFFDFNEMNTEAELYSRIGDFLTKAKLPANDLSESISAYILLVSNLKKYYEEAAKSCEIGTPWFDLYTYLSVGGKNIYTGSNTFKYNEADSKNYGDALDICFNSYENFYLKSYDRFKEFMEPLENIPLTHVKDEQVIYESQLVTRRALSYNVFYYLVNSVKSNHVEKEKKQIFVNTKLSKPSGVFKWFSTEYDDSYYREISNKIITEKKKFIRYGMKSDFFGRIPSLYNTPLGNVDTNLGDLLSKFMLYKDQNNFKNNITDLFKLNPKKELTEDNIISWMELGSKVSQLKENVSSSVIMATTVLNKKINDEQRYKYVQEQNNRFTSAELADRAENVAMAMGAIKGMMDTASAFTDAKSIGGGAVLWKTGFALVKTALVTGLYVVAANIIIQAFIFVIPGLIWMYAVLTWWFKTAIILAVLPLATFMVSFVRFDQVKTAILLLISLLLTPVFLVTIYFLIIELLSLFPLFIDKFLPYTSLGEIMDMGGNDEGINGSSIANGLDYIFGIMETVKSFIYLSFSLFMYFYFLKTSEYIQMVIGSSVQMNDSQASQDKMMRNFKMDI